MADVQTIGRLMVSSVIPEDMQDASRVFNKKGSSAFFEDLAVLHPDKYAEVLQRLNNISRIAATDYGGVSSVGLEDLKLPPRTKAYRKELRDKIKDIAQNPALTKTAKNDRIVGLMRKAMPTIQSMLEKEMVGRDNAFGMGVQQGFRGNPVQLTQMLFGDMLVADHKGRPIPIAGVHGYGEGVTPSEYWASSYGARRGFSDVQFATAKTGFLGKQLAMMSQRIQVTGEDCGAKSLGVLSDGNDPDIIGSVLSRDTNGVSAGTVIEKKHLAAMKDQSVLMRSVITCQQSEGVCQKCAGKRDQGKFPPLNSYIGLDSARVASEPMTQELGLSAKHSGGILGPESDEISGFDEVNQFVNVPKNFKGAAVLAPADGQVTQVVTAPQGGWYMHVGDEQVYVPPDRKIDVARGDKVEAGDMLTDGTPNPAEIAKHKGLGEGRAYFLEKFSEILKRNGVPTHRKNVEALSRGFFDRVRVTRPEGVLGFNIDDVALYSDIQREYTPRPGAQTLAPGRTVGQYLETPVLHYTIGTRITPSVAKTLKAEGVDNVTVHQDDPGFEPAVMRLMNIPATDPDWKVQMGGFGLQKSFLESARRGSSSPHKGTAYVGSLMDPTRL